MEIKGSVTYAIEQGPRWHQEDRYFRGRIFEDGFARMLLAVMDGHNGDDVAEFCVENLGNLFSIGPDINAEGALENLVSVLARETNDFYSGSTLAVAYVDEKHNEVSIAILGDSSVIVIDREGTPHVSPTHNVRVNVDERQAAEGRGGFYSPDGYIYNSSGSYGLQMSRSLGDARMGGVISREPEIYTISNPRWIALITDGILDFASDDAEWLIDDFVELKETDSTAIDIMDWAKNRGLEDNATVLLWKA